MDIFAPSHLLILLAIVLVIFGPSKLGDIGGALGRGIRDFKRAMNENDDQKDVTMAKAAEPAPTEIKIEKPAIEKPA